MLVLLSGITKTILLYNCIATIFTFIFYKPNTMFCEKDSKKNHITWIFLPHYSGTTQKEERDSSLIKNVIITERSIINRSTAATHTETSSKVIVQSHIMVWGWGHSVWYQDKNFTESKNDSPPQNPWESESEQDTLDNANTPWNCCLCFLFNTFCNCFCT